MCHSSECIIVDRKVCENCNRTCRSVDCYNRHREVRDKLKNVEDKSIYPIARLFGSVHHVNVC